MNFPANAPAAEGELYGIHIGGVFASRDRAVVRTVLGSCIAVCLRDPQAGVGGMNHFMLPLSAPGEQASTRYGVHAMELLINECMKLGADRHCLEAKVFGGAHVMRMRESDGNVPQSNIRFALEFLNVEGIPIRKQDLGGYAAREIYFYTESGRILLKRLEATGANSTLEQQERETLRCMAAVPKKPVVAIEDDSSITLF